MNHQAPFQKEIENLQLLLSEKETGGETEKLNASQTVKDMKHKIEKLAKKQEASSIKPNQTQERRNI